MREKHTTEIYTTKFLIDGLKTHKKIGAAFVDDFIDAIIIKLCAADRLCYAVKHAHEQEDLDKAIAVFEQGKP
jgi:hypothetical protein